MRKPFFFNILNSLLQALVHWGRKAAGRRVESDREKEWSEERLSIFLKT